jgi:hypothetical protein
MISADYLNRLPLTLLLNSAAAICAAISEPGPVESEYRLLISDNIANLDQIT